VQGADAGCTSVKAKMVRTADAVQIGTAFFACEESGATKWHRDLLFRAETRHTGLSRTFTGRYARGIYNRFSEEMKTHESQLARYPAQSWIVAPLRAAAHFNLKD
jgi:nitronate monooxygenase